MVNVYGLKMIAIIFGQGRCKAVYKERLRMIVQERSSCEIGVFVNRQMRPQKEFECVYHLNILILSTYRGMASVQEEVDGSERHTVTKPKVLHISYYCMGENCHDYKRLDNRKIL